MLKKVYCLLETEPEVISGFADFADKLASRHIELEMLEKEGLAERLSEFEADKACVLITDLQTEADKSIPVAGFLTERNGSLGYKYLFESFKNLTLDYFIMVYNRFYGLPLEILETKRLRVREIALEDLDALYEVYSDPSITKYMEGLYPDKKDELEFTKSYIENMYGFYGYGLWLVIEKDTGKIIGRAGLSNRELDGEIYLELGYVMAKESQGKGYATEVSLAILDYAKEELGATQVIALIRAENIVSIRTAEKLGFYKECEVTLGDDKEKYLKFCIRL